MKIHKTKERERERKKLYYFIYISRLYSNRVFAVHYMAAAAAVDIKRPKEKFLARVNSIRYICNIAPRC